MNHILSAINLVKFNQNWPKPRWTNKDKNSSRVSEGDVESEAVEGEVEAAEGEDDVDEGAVEAADDEAHEAEEDEQAQ